MIPRGLYIARIGNSTPLSIQIWQTPYISGVVYAPNWNSIETDIDVMQWKNMDRMVSDSGLSGKSIILGIKPGLNGSGFPLWYQGLRYTRDNGESTGYWLDPIYKSRISQTINRIVTRYDSYPQVVGYVLIGFFNWAFAEMALGRGNTPEDRQRLIDAPYEYTREGVGNACNQLITGITRISQKPLRLAFNQILDESTSGLSFDSTDEYVLEPTNTDFPGVVYSGRTNLKPTTPDPLGQFNQTPLGQTDSLVWKYRNKCWWQADLPDNGGPLTASEWDTSIRIAGNYGATWVEIRDSDVANPGLVEVFEAAAERFRAP